MAGASAEKNEVFKDYKACAITVPSIPLVPSNPMTLVMLPRFRVFAHGQNVSIARLTVFDAPRSIVWISLLSLFQTISGSGRAPAELQEIRVATPDTNGWLSPWIRTYSGGTARNNNRFVKMCESEFRSWGRRGEQGTLLSSMVVVVLIEVHTFNGKSSDWLFYWNKYFFQKHRGSAEHKT